MAIFALARGMERGEHTHLLRRLGISRTFNMNKKNKPNKKIKAFEIRKVAPQRIISKEKKDK